jgi:hypothetical protein
MIRCAIMAPSGHNTQPWLFKISNDAIKIMPDMSRRLPVADRDDRELFISLGAALENILIAAPQFGFNAEYEVIDSESDKILIHISDKNGTKNEQMFQAMIERQTTRNEYMDKQLSENLPARLDEITNSQAAFYYTTEKKNFDTFIDYVKEGNRLLFRNKKFLEELKKWIRWNDSEAEEKLDGLYIRALNQPSTPAWLGKMVFNFTITEKTQNKKEENGILSASGLLFLFSETGKKHWIEAGRKLERILIALTGGNIKYAFHNQPCQSIPLRFDFARTFEHKGLIPQAAIRMGYGNFLPRSPRRKIKDIIVP